MPHQGKMQQQVPEEPKKARLEEQFIPGQHSFGIPNSAGMSTAMTPPAGTPNSVMREMETDDRGGLFRGRGFDTSVGAHELSHTVRREYVPSPVSLSAPSGTIQRDPDDPDSEESPQQLAATISSERQRANNLERIFALRNRENMITQLSGKIGKEEDPEVLKHMTELKGNLERIPVMFGYVNDALDRASAQLKNAGGADLGSIKRDLAFASKNLNELVATYNQMDHFWRNPNMFDDEREYQREINKEVADFEVMTPGDYDEPPAEDEVTPGGDESEEEQEPEKKGFFDSFFGLFRRKKRK